MNVSVELTPGLLQHMDRLVRGGFYKSRSEVVRDAVRSLIRNELRTQMRAKGLTSREFQRLRDDVARERLPAKYRAP